MVKAHFGIRDYIKAGLSSYFPAKGVIDVSVGDTILIELKARREVRDFFVSESPVPDTAQFTKFSPVNTTAKSLYLNII